MSVPEVVLVNPRIGLYSRVFRPFIPLALLSAATGLDSAGYRVTIIDQHTAPDWEERLRRALARDPICVGVTSMTGTQLRGALQASRIARAGGATVVWGGVHASLFPEPTIRHPDIDVLVRGEGELALLELVQALEAGTDLARVPGLTLLRDGRLISTGDRPFLDLDRIPNVPYHLLPVRDYLHTYFYRRQVIEIETSRGCPFRCGFCYNERYNRCTWRPRSATAVLRTIRRLNADWGIQNVLAIDDSFFISRRRVMAIADGLIAEGPRVNWGAQGRLQGVLAMNDGELARLAASGCRFLQFGVEAGDQTILNLIDKRISVAEVIEVNRRLREIPGLYVFYNFMVGLPTETEATIRRTVALAWRLLEENRQASIGTIHVYKEYPGTRLYRLSLREGYVPPRALEEWAAYDWQSGIQRRVPRRLRTLMDGIKTASYAVDDKVAMLGDSRLAAAVARIYRPLARWRFRNRFFGLMPERILG